MIKTKVIETRLAPGGDVDAITLFGLVFTRDRRRVDRRLLNHELIHCQQQREWLYLPFFILYALEWLWYMIRFGGDRRRAYRAISFEREAYDHAADPDYLRHRPLYNNYRK